MEITCQPRDLGVGFQEDTDIMNGHYQLILFVQLESSVRQQFCSLLCSRIEAERRIHGQIDKK